MKSIKLPFDKGRWIYVPGDREGSALTLSSEVFSTNLVAEHRKKNGKTFEYDLGSGLVTNIGVNAMANDPNFITASTAFCTLSTMNYHACGTGTTAAAATDYYLQTVTGSGSLTGSTNGYYTGTQSVTAPNIYKTVATFTYSASVAVTEWGLVSSNAANFSGTATSTSSTSLTNTGASFTNTGNKLAGWTILANASAANSPTTLVQGLVTVSGSNSGTVLAVPNGWWTLANASASTPSGTTAYVVYPTMWDHKVFSAINVNNGDTIQFTYSLTINSGG